MEIAKKRNFQYSVWDVKMFEHPVKYAFRRFAEFYVVKPSALIL